MKIIFRIAFGFGTLALLSVENSADAQRVFFYSNAVIDYTTPDGAVVGYASPDDLLNKANGANPSVSLVAQGYIGYTVYVYNKSNFSVADGYINGGIDSYNNSVVTISGGSLYLSLEARDSSIDNVYGGKIGGNLYAK